MIRSSDSQVKIEASGNITLQTIRAVAETGVDPAVCRLLNQHGWILKIAAVICMNATLDQLRIDLNKLCRSSALNIG